MDFCSGAGYLLTTYYLLLTYYLLTTYYSLQGDFCSGAGWATRLESEKRDFEVSVVRPRPSYDNGDTDLEAYDNRGRGRRGLGAYDSRGMKRWGLEAWRCREAIIAPHSRTGAQGHRKELEAWRCRDMASRPS